MKLLVIVLCLLSEKYLIHAASFTRFAWFAGYARYLETTPVLASLFTIPWVRLLVFIVPILLIVSLIWFLVAGVFYGVLNLILNLIVFYYCLGPANPFYPDEQDINPAENEEQTIHYLCAVNRELFSSIFWYMIAGIPGVLLHRLATLCLNVPVCMTEAKILTDIMEWLPARVLGFLCLLTGNFQRGFIPWKNHFFAGIHENRNFLAACGLEALRFEPGAVLSVTLAEHMVNHALIVLLVILAVVTTLAGV